MKRTFTKYPSNYVSASSNKTYEFLVKRYDDYSLEGKIETLHARSWQEAVDALNEDETVEWWQVLRD